MKSRLGDRDGFEAKLAEIGLDFSPIFWQHDRVYVPREYRFGKNMPRLTVRTEMRAVDRPAKYSLILRRHIEDSGVDIAEETEVTNYEGAVRMILQLGFKPVGEVARRRQALDMGNGTFIFLDEIDGRPGSYAKIVSPLMEGDSVAEARSDLKQTFQTLGESDFVELPYFEMWRDEGVEELD